jgi:hypothetical protein
MWHAWGRREILAGFWWRKLKKRENVEHVGIYGRIILKCIGTRGSPVG